MLAERLPQFIWRKVQRLGSRGERQTAINLANCRLSHGLVTTVASMLNELDDPGLGSEIMLARLIDLVFIQMMRIWVAEHPAETSWLAGAADARIGRALAALHAAPTRPWSVSVLAQHAGLARSAFNARFRAIVGKPPATYVLEWRLNLAADRLHATLEPVNKIARDLGYGSEAAFSRAFKARFGVSPRSFRKRVFGENR